MDIRQLRYFKTAAELGSLSRAAAILDISQPSLGQQIRRLEDTLGIPLFARNGRGLVPTEAGRCLLEHAQGILEKLDLAEKKVREIGREGASRFTIGLSYTIATILVKDLVHKLREAEPQMILSIVQGKSKALQDGIWSGEIDAAIMFEAPASALIETVPLLKDELFLAGPLVAGRSSDVVSASTLADYPLILPSSPSALRRIIERSLQGIRKTPRVVIEVDNGTSGVELAANGHGFVILPKQVILRSKDAKRVRMRKIVDPTLHSVISFATSSRGSRNPMKRRMLELTREIGIKMYKSGSSS